MLVTTLKRHTDLPRLYMGRGEEILKLIESFSVRKEWLVDLTLEELCYLVSELTVDYTVIN